jgi:hypothetical protein
MNNQSQLVGIYRLYKLGRMSGSTFSKDIKINERGLHPVHHSFAEKSNANHTINGLWYEEDQEATRLYWAKQPYDLEKEYTKFEEVKGIEEKTIGKVEEGIKIKEVQFKLSQMSKDELIDFAEKNEFKIKKTKSVENILTEIIAQIEI